MKNPTLDDMWKRLEGFGIKRETFELSNPSEETIQQLYEMIKQKEHQRRNEKQQRILEEYISKLKAKYKL